MTSSVNRQSIAFVLWAVCSPSNVRQLKCCVAPTEVDGTLFDTYSGVNRPAGQRRKRGRRRDGRARVFDRIGIPQVLGMHGWREKVGSTLRCPYHDGCQSTAVSDLHLHNRLRVITRFGREFIYPPQLPRTPWSCHWTRLEYFTRTVDEQMLAAMFPKGL